MQSHFWDHVSPRPCRTLPEITTYFRVFAVLERPDDSMQRVIADSHFLQRLPAVDNGTASHALRTYSTNSLRESRGDLLPIFLLLHPFDPFDSFFDV